MPILKCRVCNKEFYAKLNWIKKGYGKYCSVGCRGIFQRMGKKIKCHTCGKEIYRSLRDIKRSKSGNFFCNKICSNEWIGKQQRTENNPNWEGGESSYKIILKRTDSSPTCFLCGENNYRILCAHHKDKNRSNNNVQNLIWLCRNCHFLVHHYKNEENHLNKKLNLINAKG
jgi:hypothetical protein